MNVAVCIKQVPGTTNVKINPETNTLVRDGVESQINPFDVYALEEAVRIRERAGEGKVTVITMGPPQAQNALREAIELGANEGILLSDRAFAGSDTWATAYTLACALKKLEYDLIVCGMQAIDGDTGQVGPGIAVHLGIPQVTYVSKIESLDKRKATVQRLVEEGHEVVQVDVPALFTVVKEINEPRTPSLRGKMAAKKAQIPVWTAADLEAPAEKLGLLGSPTQVVKIFSPDRRGGGEKWEGDGPELAVKLIDRLREMQII